MKKVTLLIIVFLNFPTSSFAQNNPVTGLTWTPYYTFMHNWFELNWLEPESPHDELIGYNVYRENDFYRFQTETSLNHLEIGENCGEDFLYYGDFNGFTAHVTAVYAGGIESGYIETIEITGPLLGVNQFENQNVALYPNPTDGIVTIGNENVEHIRLFDISGKSLREWQSERQIDLSDFAKGIYFIQLVSKTSVRTGKVVLK